MRGLHLSSSLNACTEFTGWLAHGWLGSDDSASKNFSLFVLNKIPLYNVFDLELK
jgi:hypothetical protein